MAVQLDPQLLRRYTVLAGVAGIAVALIGALVLVGWLFGLRLLAAPVPSQVAMNPATAIAFVLGGVAIRLNAGPAKGNARRVALALAALVALAGLVRLLGYALGFDPAFDHLLFAPQLDHEIPPNRMAPNTALSFLLAGLALLTLDAKARGGFQPAQYFALASGLVAYVALIGYAYQATGLEVLGSYIPMALHTALAFGLMTTGILWTRLDRTIMAVFSADTDGGRMARRLLPSAAAVVFVLGWLTLQAQWAGLFGSAAGIAFLVGSTILIVGSFIWWNGALLSRAEAEHLRAERALARAREQEAEISYRIQQTLLLEQPPHDVPGLHVAALTIPSRGIDGDFYDFYRHIGQRLDIIVGDVMGKGIPAALLGAATKTHFLESLSQLSARARAGVLPEPKEIVTLTHSSIVKHLISLDNFVTVCYARISLADRRVDMVDAGHTPTLHYRERTGEVVPLKGDNLPLGFSEREIYDQFSTSLDPGDLLVFYSDGITEARSRQGEFFGLDRLMECVKAHHHLTPEELVEQIRLAIVGFSGLDKFGDDLTCVAVKLEEHMEAAPMVHEELDVPSDLRELAHIRAFVREVCTRLPDLSLDEDSVDQLELAITEATSNVIKHAYHGRSDQPIQIVADVFVDRVVIVLQHLGEGFDPSRVEPPAFDGSRDHGFGMYIIAHSVDEVRYYRDELGRNCISLVKQRRGDAAKG